MHSVDCSVDFFLCIPDLIWIKSCLSNSASFFACAIAVLFKKTHCLCQCLQVFFFNSFTVSDLLLRYLFHSELIFIKSERCKSFVSNFCIWKHILLKRFSPGIFIVPLSKIIDCRCMDLSPGFHFCSIGLYACFYAVLCCFGYNSPIVCFKTQYIMH